MAPFSRKSSGDDAWVFAVSKIGFIAPHPMQDNRELAGDRHSRLCHASLLSDLHPMTALAFRATIDQPDRFRRSRDVGAHLGLTPTSKARSADVAMSLPAPPSMRRLIR
jgi:hypothetical protein